LRGRSPGSRAEAKLSPEAMKGMNSLATIGRRRRTRERDIYQGGYFVNVGMRQWEEWPGNTKAYSCREHNRPPFSAQRVCLSPPAAQPPAPSRQAAGTGSARRPLQARPFPSPAPVARRRGAGGHPSRRPEAYARGVGHQRAPRGTPIPPHRPGARPARPLATSCGGCLGPRISPSSRRAAPALGHRSTARDHSLS